MTDLTISAIFTKSGGQPATGLTLSDLKFFLTQQDKATGTDTTVWDGTQVATIEINNVGMYTRILATADLTLYSYFAMVQYTGATVLDSNYVYGGGGQVEADTRQIEGVDATDQIRDSVLTDATRFAGADIATIKGYIDTEIAAILAAVDTEIAAIKAKTDQLVFTVANQLDSNALRIEGVDATNQIRDAILSDSTPFAGSNIATILAAVDTEIASILAAVDTEVAAIKAKTDNLPTDPADESSIQGTLTTIAGYIDTEVASILAAVDTEVAAIKAKTDNLPTDPADESNTQAAIASVLAAIAALNNPSTAAIVTAIFAGTMEGRAFEEIIKDIWAQVVGDFVANDDDDPTSIVYEGPNGATQLTHAITDTTRSWS